MADKMPEIVLFTYEESIQARRISWYLTLRSIPYNECVVLNRLPRPALTALNISYRRIPILAIGKDVYCDTRLIHAKLESLYPSSNLSAHILASDLGLCRLLETWTLDSLFMRLASILPSSFPPMQDPEWLADRAEMLGRPMGQTLSDEAREQNRAEGMAHVQAAFELVENTWLADGRKWICGTQGVTLADLMGIWPFDWVMHKDLYPGDKAPEQLSKARYPKVYAWVARFQDALADARKANKPPLQLGGEEVLKLIADSEYAEPKGEVDASDPLGLKKGQEIEVWPIDSGVNHRDQGKLVGLNVREVVGGKKTNEVGEEVRVHFPRTNFRIQPVGAR